MKADVISMEKHNIHKRFNTSMINKKFIAGINDINK